MEERPAQKPVIDKSATIKFSADRPWPWISYEDPAWPLEPWVVSNDEDLADAAARLGIWYLTHSVEGMTVLKAASLFEDATRRVVADVVAEARTQRFSWGRIAQAFGVGRTAAQKRFGKHPNGARTETLENQYRWMSEYLYAADRDTPAAYPDREEIATTRERCIRRRRGHHLNPMDTMRKVVPRRKKRS